jgi:LPXTG-motif cell wall-anchored protein
MRPSFIRAGVVFTTIATAGAVSLASSAQAAPAFSPDLVGEAQTAAAVPDVTGTVPAGVCSGSFIIRGSGGDGLSLGAQSYPGQVVGSLTLVAGQSVVLKTGAPASGSTGGLGGYAAGGNGLTAGSDLGYGGGAASGFLLNGTAIAVGGGGGGAGNNQQGNGRGGAGGGGTNGAGENGTNLFSINTAEGGAIGAQVSSVGQNASSVYRLGGGANPNGGGGGGGGWNGGQGGTAGASGGGGSNYANLSAAGININSSGSYNAVASGYAGLAYAACPVPSAISAVTVTPNGTSAALSFSAAVDNGTPVTAYQYSLNGGTSWNTLTTSGSSTKTATISSLSLSTVYTVQVRPVYVTADIRANATTSTPAGPGRGVTAYVSATTQSFTTLAQNRVLAETGTTTSFAPLAGALAALVAGASLVIARRKNESF